MKKTPTIIFVIIVWLCWLLPYEGKKLFPDILGRADFQWPFAIIVAVSIPIAVLFGLRMMASTDQRRKGFGIIVVVLFPLIFNLVTYGIGGIMIARASGILGEMHNRDVETIAALIDRARSDESLENRKKVAGLLYSMFGIKAVLRNNLNNLEIYTPTDTDVTNLKKSKETDSIALSSKALLENQLKQILWLSGLSLGCFVLIVLSGLGWHAYRNNSTV